MLVGSSQQSRFRFSEDSVRLQFSPRLQPALRGLSAMLPGPVPFGSRLAQSVDARVLRKIMLTDVHGYEINEACPQSQVCALLNRFW